MRHTITAIIAAGLAIVSSPLASADEFASNAADPPPPNQPRFTAAVSLAPPELRYVPPGDTDPDIGERWNEPHVLAPPLGTPRGALVLFFPGTGAVPTQYEEFIAHAAGRGFHAVALRYPNDLSMNFQVCGDDPDVTCFERGRLEIFDGIDRHPLLDVTPPESIRNRLLKLLLHLEAEHPEEQWDAFLERSIAGEPTIRWDRIILSGHSQGGGHAAFIATQRVARGVLLFAGGPDYMSVYQDFAPWMERTLTPPDRYAGFAHVLDSFTAFRNSWTLFGMDAFGPLINADANQPPYFGANRLYTLAEPGPDPLQNWPHNIVIADDYLRRNAAGELAYAPVWSHMLDHVMAAAPADTDGDGLVQSDRIVIDILANLGAEGDAELQRLDLDGDGAIGPADLLRLIQR